MGVNGIYGLSGSGMDIESMVKVGMMSKQNEYDKMAQKYTKNEWIKADYLELNSKITTFNSTTLSQYKYSTTMNAKIAESTSSAIKVSATSSATNMSHRVSVDSLSTNAYLISTADTIKRQSGNNTSITLKDVLFKSFESDGDGNFSFSTNNLSDEKALGKWTSASGSDTAFSFKISDGVTKNDDGSIKTAEISFTFDDINNGATLNDLVSKIKNAGLNITASYDSVNDRFSIYNTKSGEDNTINISLGKNKSTNYSASNTGRFLNSLGLYKSDGDKLVSLDGKTKGEEGATALTFKTNSSQSVAGSTGKIIVDGAEYKMSDNKITVNGVTYTALDKTSSAATVSISQDTDSIIDKVKSFVSEYNTLLASLYEKYDEKPESGYSPLTQSQKDQMKDEQITKWEEKAKKGTLYHDQTLGKIIQNMRSAISESVDLGNGKTASVFSIGISTTGIKGQLTLDEDKLKKALDNDPDIVYNTFAKLDSSDLDNSSKSGIAQRLGDIFVDANSKIKDRAGSSSDITEDSDLNTLLRNLQTKMSNFKRTMATFEEQLYKKYDNMESMLAKLGSQLNYVMGSSS